MSQLSLTTAGSPAAGPWTRGRLTWGVVAALFGVYWGYSLLITPLAVPPSIAKEAPPSTANEVSPPLANREAAEKFLKHVTWAKDARYQLRTESSYVYAEDWTPIDAEKAVRFKPFAMVWMQKGRKPGQPPITIVADSAYVQFARKFDVTKPDPGRVVGGSLEGRVEIRGPDGLKVVGRTFFFSEKAMLLWSDEPLRFEYGLHHGKAVGLQCDLLPVEGPVGPDQFRIGGFENVRLRRDVEMNLLFQGSEKRKLTGKGGTAEPAKLAARTPKKPTPVRIRSKGSFEFGVQTNVATFEDDVRVVRMEKPGLPDELYCELLTLVFERDEKAARKKAAKKSKSGERFQTIDSKLAFRRLRAQPRLPKRHVVLISRSNHLTAHTGDLIHDGQSNVTVLQDPEGVDVVQENSRIRAPKITVVRDRKQDATKLRCDGAGWIVHFDKKTGRRDFTATWKKSLQKMPDDKSDLDIIDLEQDVVLRQPQEKSDLQAQFVRVWVDRRKKNKKKSVNGTGERERIRPRRMLALERVVMNSPDLRTYTKRLEVWFEHLPPVSGGLSRDALVPTSRHYSGVARRPRGGWIALGASLRSDPGHPGSLGAMASVGGPGFGPPANRGRSPAGNSRPKKTPGRDKKDGPLHVWADLVRVQVAIGRGRRKNEVREVWTLGNVQVKQKHESGEEPLRINGDRMHVVNRSKTDQVLHVYGKPAHIRDRRMHIEGDRVHLDREKNRAWVDGKGLLQLPVDKTLDGRKLDKPQLLDVWWRKNMTFDGEVARFRGQVRGVVENSRVRCEELDVTMTERVEFGERRSGVSGQESGVTSQGSGVRGQSTTHHSPLTTHRAKIRQILCRDNVQFESYEYEGSKLVQIRKGRVHNLTVDQLTGETDAQGPGWMALWRRGKRRQARIGGPGLVRPNEGVSRPRKSEWDYTRIDFTDQSKGNFRKRYTRFGNRVNVVYGPVKRPPHVIDPDDLPEGGGWMRCRDLLVTQFAKAKTTPAYMTLRGDGNAEVEGMNFHARADTITYNEIQDLYVLRSIGRRDATIWRQTELGGNRSRADAKRMEFIPSQNRLKLVDTKRLDGLR